MEVVVRMKIVTGGTDKKNRGLVENKTVDVLLSPEKGRTKDFMKFRNSGLNQVLCKLANKNKVAIGFNFDDVLNSKDYERVSLLGKMIQNVKLCGRYNVKMIIFSKDRNEKDLKCFGSILGMHPSKINIKRFL